jgi:diguanylate cyclase (GGDEF)-like protein
MFAHPDADNIPQKRYRRRHPNPRPWLGVHVLNSFKLKLVAYFVLLSLLPMAAAFWGFTTVAGVSNTRQVDARLQAGLRTALTAYQQRVALDQAAAEQLARLRAFQLDLERRDRPRLGGLLRDSPDLSVVGPGGLRVGHSPPLAVRSTVDVVTRAGRIGAVVASLPLDDALVASLRAGAGLDPSDVLALVDGNRIVASAPFARGGVALNAGRTATVAVGDRRYRVLVAPALPGTQASLAVLSPQSLIDAADSTARNRLLLGLLASLALVSIVAYVEGRAIVRNLGALARAAHAIAHGRLSERVPVRGGDEFALLGDAFNDMAEQLEARVAELQAERGRLADAVSRVGAALAASRDIEQLLRVIAETAVEATGAAGASVSVDGGPTVASGDAAAAGERFELTLVAGAQALGTLLVVGESFDEEQRETARSLASHAAVALDNARLHRMVERQALVDGLTGVANRRRCEEALNAEVARAERLGTPLSLVLADLDDFKAVNDLHGHATGDEVLRRFAEVLRATVRESDVAGRWGGEEFMLLLPGADGTGAAQLADRVRVALAARPVNDAEGSTFTVSCSFGVAEHRPGTDPAALFASADRALYRAKREGKDRVELEPLVRSF